MVYIFFLVMLTVVHVCQCAGGARLRASESSEAENERDVFFFFFSVRGTTEGSRDDFHYASWCASSLDKEDGWEFAYLL
jgi:hypothetical protein